MVSLFTYVSIFLGRGGFPLNLMNLKLQDPSLAWLFKCQELWSIFGGREIRMQTESISK